MEKNKEGTERLKEGKSWALQWCLTSMQDKGKAGRKEKWEAEVQF